MTTTAKPVVQDIYPLSPTQQGMLFHSLYEPNSGVYAVQVGLTLKGQINLELFSQAWQKVIGRHSTLRTAFVWDDLDAPLQVVGRQAELSIATLDWQSFSPDEQAQKLEQWLEGDRTRGFNLAHAPLMRVTLIQMEPEVYRLVWSYHHLILDGWSVP
ncbi:MAG: condensation domain-containing protein, partial [Cyanobacteria bacterium P01_F01_bin.42]